MLSRACWHPCTLEVSCRLHACRQSPPVGGGWRWEFLEEEWTVPLLLQEASLLSSTEPPAGTPGKSPTHCSAPRHYSASSAVLTQSPRSPSRGVQASTWDYNQLNCTNSKLSTHVLTPPNAQGRIP